MGFTTQIEIEDETGGIDEKDFLAYWLGKLG